MVYKTEYSQRRVYSSSNPSSPNVATSYSYSVNPIARRRKQLVTTRVIRVPLAVPLSDQEVLNFVTLGSGRAGSVPRIAVQRLTGIASPPRTNARLNELYSELEDEVARDSQGLGAMVPYRSRSVTPLRALSPGPIKSITFNTRASSERELSPLRSLPEINSAPIVRSRADDVLLHLALGLPPPLYSLHHIPLRSALDLKEACDVRRQYVHERNLYDPISRLQSDIYRMAFNRAPRKLPDGYIAGNGTLACLTYAGGRPIPKRRRFYPDESNSPIVVTDDVNKFNNYYKPSAVGSYYSTAGRKPVYQPIFRSKKTLLGLPDTPSSYRKAAPESKWESRSAGKRSPSPPPAKAPIRRIISTSSPPPEPRKPAADNVSVTLPRPRKSISTDEAVVIPPPSPTKNQSLDVPDAVVVRIPRKSISQEPLENPPQPPKEQEEEEVVQVVKLKRPSVQAVTPPSEPEPEPVVEAEPAPEPSPTEEAPAEAEAAAEPEGEAEPSAPEPAVESSEAEPAAPAETSEAEPAPVAEPTSEAEPEPAAETTEPVAESAAAAPSEEPTEPEAAPAAEPEREAAPDAEPEQEAAPAAEPEPEAAPAAEPEPEAAPAAESVSEAEPAPAAQETSAEEPEAAAEPEVSEAASTVEDEASAPAPAPVETEDISAATEEPSNQGEASKDEEEAVTLDEPKVEDNSAGDVEPSVEKEETDRQIASPVEGYDDEPAEPEELPLDSDESLSEARRRGVSEDDRTLEED